MHNQVDRKNLDQQLKGGTTEGYRPQALTRTDLTALRKGAQVVKFRNLPKAAQLALVHYMAVNGEAWELAPQLEPDHKPGWKQNRESWASYLSKTLPFYIQRYGDYRIGYAPCIPTERLTAAVMRNPVLAGDFESWADYHKWYVTNMDMPTYQVVRNRMWPVILSSYDDETLQDGWHRLNHYIQRGAECIPGLFYVDQDEPLTVRGHVVDSPNIGSYPMPQETHVTKYPRIWIAAHGGPEVVAEAKKKTSKKKAKA